MLSAAGLSLIESESFYSKITNQISYLAFDLLVLGSIAGVISAIAFAALAQVGYALGSAALAVISITGVFYFQPTSSIEKNMAVIMAADQKFEDQIKLERENNKSLQTEVDRLNQQLSDLQVTLDEKTKEAAVFADKFSKAEKHFEQLKPFVERLKSISDGMETNVSELASHDKKIQGETKKIVDGSSSFKIGISSLNAERASIEQEISQFEKLNKEMEIQTNRLMKGIELLQNQAKELREERKKFLEKMQQGRESFTNLLGKVNKDEEIKEQSSLLSTLSPLSNLAKLAKQIVNKKDGK